MYYTHFNDLSDTTSAKEIRIYDLKEYFINLFTQEGETIDSLSMKDEIYRKKMQAFHVLSGLLQQVILYAYLIYCVVQKGLGIGTMTIYLSTVSKISTALTVVFNQFLEIKRYCLDITEYMSFMSIPTSQEKSGRYTPVFDASSIIEFKNVSFKYPDADEYILKDISFKVNKGETIAFIGGTGSGKSTLVNLIPRFYDAGSGEILVDGENVRDYKLTDLHNLLGYVSQKAFMFSSSVLENITYGKSLKKIDEEAVLKSLEVSQAKPFVDSMPDGVNSFIARGGTNVSGGQKQRLSIARAIARDPEIYIFDDTFSALDYKTDFKLRQELRKHTKEATVLIVAQRIGTIIDASKIVVLDEGKIVDIGTHKELLERCSLYKEIATSQLDMEELQ